MSVPGRRRAGPCRLRGATLVLPPSPVEPHTPSTVGGLSIVASADGLEVVSPTGHLLSTFAWSEVRAVDAASLDEQTASLTIERGDAAHHFLAPAADVEALVGAAAALRRRPGPGATPHGGRGRHGVTPGRRGPGAWPGEALRAVGLTVVAVARRRGRRPAHGTGTLWLAPHPTVDLGGALFRTVVRPTPAHAVAGRGRRREGRAGGARVARRVTPTVACVCALTLVAGGGLLGSLHTGGSLAGTRVAVHPDPDQGQGAGIMADPAQALWGSSQPPVVLPPATAPPAPAPPSLAGAPALRPHEIFGFAPYWALPLASTFDLAAVTTLAYFSVDVNGDGSIVQSGPGWAGYQSQDLADLVTRAHAAGDRVVLTATCFGQAALNQLTADPTSGGRLGASLVQLIEAKNLDGVNIDFEGRGSGDQAGLNTLMAAVSAAVRQADPHDQVTMDTYASAAGDPTGFYDIAGLNPSVDAFFVMAYDMNSRSVPSPTSPLSGGAGFSDTEAVQQYVAAVGASKVILGVPYYGYDWPTAGPGLGDPATGPPTPVTYAEVLARGSPVYWDPTTQTPWTSYQVGTQWHQTWFDDPTSLALKAELANTYHLAGLGIWAMGMEGDTSAMLAALEGSAPVVKDLPRGPAPSVHPPTTTTPVSYVFSGSWDGGPVTLSAVDPASVPAGTTVAGQAPLVGFATDDPAVACLQNGPALAVSALSGSPGVYVVRAAPPADCASGTWEFTVPVAPAPTVTSTVPTSTTSTTVAGSTPSTTSTTSTTDP